MKREGIFTDHALHQETEEGTGGEKRGQNSQRRGRQEDRRRNKRKKRDLRMEGMGEKVRKVQTCLIPKRSKKT